MKLIFNRNTLNKLKDINKVMEADSLLIIDGKNPSDMETGGRVYISLNLEGNGEVETVNGVTRYKRTQGGKVVTVSPTKGLERPTVTEKEFTYTNEAQQYFIACVTEMFL